MSNIKSFRNLLTSQTKNYKISPDNYEKHVKLNGLTPTHLDYFEDTSTSCSIDGIYTIKPNSGGDETGSKNDTSSSNNNNHHTTLFGYLSNHFRRLLNFYYNCKNTHCLLTYLTPVACR